MFTGGSPPISRQTVPNPHTYLFPSGVETEHFAPAPNLALPTPPDLSTLHPMLGYFGVIDERMDLRSGHPCRAHPEWQFVMVGPVVKIDPATLPQAPNIHWAGMKLTNFRLSGSFRRGANPICAERIDPLSEPDENAGIYGPHKPIVSTPIPRCYGAYMGMSCAYAATPERS